MNTGNHDHLKTPANMNGTTTSPWRAKIQRIGLLNMIYIITARARLTNPANQKYKYIGQNPNIPLFSNKVYRKRKANNFFTYKKIKKIKPTTNENTRTNTTNHAF
jgi:hypothetical protein